MTVTTLRRKKANIYGVIPSGDDYYAFSSGFAMLYVDGSYASTRATGGPSITEAPSLIHTDSEAIVGPGSTANRIDESTLEVWDVDGAATYTYAVPAGWVCSPAIYAGGYLWWVEREAVQHGGVGTYATDFRLRKSRTDLLTSLATVYTYTAAHHVGFSAVWNPILGLAVTTSGVIVQCHWADAAAGEVQDNYQVRFARDGSGATDNGWSVIGPGVFVDEWVVNTAPTTAAGVAGSAVSTGFLASLADDAEASPAALWSGAEWQLSPGFANASLSADGTEGSLYNGTELVRGPASAGTPTSRFTAGPAPDESVPSYLFIKG